MAIKEIRRVNNGLGGELRSMLCDLIADIITLPGIAEGVIPGSTALCIENKKNYVLSVAGVWTEIVDPITLNSIFI